MTRRSEMRAEIIEIPKRSTAVGPNRALRAPGGYYPRPRYRRKPSSFFEAPSRYTARRAPPASLRRR